MFNIIIPRYRAMFVDQSSECCGFALTEDHQLITAEGGHGVLLPTGNKCRIARLDEMEQDLHDLVAFWQPNELIYERIHYKSCKSGAASEALAEAGLMCKKAAVRVGIPYYTIRPQDVKSACFGHAQAEKEDVKRAVCHLFGLDPDEIIRLDHSDALGMAAAWPHYREQIIAESRSKGRKKR